MQLTIESTIPAERGMGSSAAVATAVTRAFYDYLAFPLSREILLEKMSSFSEKSPTVILVESMQPLRSACSRFILQKGILSTTFL